MKKLLYLLCFLPFCLQAQTPKTTIASDNDSLSDTLPHRTSYMSFFGKNRTVYAIYVVDVSFDPEGEPIDIGPSSTHEFEFNGKEKEYNGKVYKLDIRGTRILREDTVLGRLYRYYPELDTEVLLCDMSLHNGDTFRLPFLPKSYFLPNWLDYYYYEWGYPLIVDTVFNANGVKHIHFQYLNRKSIFYEDNDGVCKRYGLPLSFIEGVGPSYGIGYTKLAGDSYLPLMLCLHKDDTVEFMLHKPTGCHQTGAAVKEPKRTTLTLQPNPAQDYILLRNEDASDLGGEIIITDAIGRVLLHRTMEDAEMSINTSRYSSGTYFVRYRSKNGVQVLKFVKVE